jgi:hypothetical protein
MDAGAAALAGIVVLAVLWLLFALIAKSILWPLMVFNGIDNRPSTSKFQFFFWTVLIVWAYVAVAFRQWLDAKLGTAGIDVPKNLLTVMGISVGATVGAKVIARNDQAKTRAAAPGSYASLVSDDNGMIALEKVQFLAWTLVAGGIFVSVVNSALSRVVTPTGLPDIDATLLTLTGISAGTYLAAKGVGTQSSNRRQGGGGGGGGGGARAGKRAAVPPPSSGSVPLTDAL